MYKILLVLVLALFIFIILEYCIKDKYFNNKIYYYNVLKNILSILVLIFIMINRKYIKEIEGLGNLIVISSIFIFLFYSVKLYKNILILKDNKLLWKPHIIKK